MPTALGEDSRLLGYCIKEKLIVDEETIYHIRGNGCDRARGLFGQERARGRIGKNPFNEVIMASSKEYLDFFSKRKFYYAF